jgi:hypothetical protein
MAHKRFIDAIGSLLVFVCGGAAIAALVYGEFGCAGLRVMLWWPGYWLGVCS